MKPDFEFTPDENGLLSKGDLKKVESILKSGGLCILPSDSAYTLTGLLTCRGIAEDIDVLLEREQMAISLAFHDSDQVTSKLELSENAYKYLTRFTPGPITFVAKPASTVLNQLSEKNLFADGSIGVRVSDSPVERQAATHFPIPTTPIRSGKMLIRDLDEAIQMILSRMEEKHIKRPLIVIRENVPFPGRTSVVVKEYLEDGTWYLKVLRKPNKELLGYISEEELEKAAREYGYEVKE